eukprot:g3642.t1
MAFWSSLQRDILARCVKAIELNNTSPCPEEYENHRQTLNAMSLVCRHWRRTVFQNLRSLSPRGTFELLPGLVEKSPKLQILDLCKCKPWSAGEFISDPVADFTNDVETLYSNLNKLEELRELKELAVRHISDAAIPKIALLHDSLQCLYIGGYLALTAEGILPLANLKKLRKLEIDGGGTIASIGYQFLSNLVQLESLRLHNCQLRDAELEYISGLKKLNYLSFSSCHRITGSGFNHLEALVNLQSLDLSGTSIQPDALLHLKPCRKLRTLDLSFCRYLLPSGLISAAGCLSITTLKLVRCESLTLENVTELKMKLRDCCIQFQKTGDVFQEDYILLK